MDHLPSIFEVLGSSPSTAKKKRIQSILGFCFGLFLFSQGSISNTLKFENMGVNEGTIAITLNFI